jgi:hypothetical protein
MFNKMKTGMAKAADATSRGTKSLAVKSSISAQKGHIESEKRAFGLKAFDALEANDDAALQAAFAESKEKIDGFRAKLAELEKELAELQVPKHGEGEGDHRPPRRRNTRTRSTKSLPLTTDTNIKYMEIYLHLRNKLPTFAHAASFRIASHTILFVRK